MNKKQVSIILLLLLLQPLFLNSKEFDFLGLRLGMTQTDVTNVLTRNPHLRIDESRFLGKINDSVPFIIKANYFPFIENIYVQFNNNSSYGITIQFNPGYFDFLSLSETLQEKYGKPSLHSSKLVIWENFTNNSPAAGKDIKLRLEYPSTVKIYDNEMMKLVNSDVSQTIVKITNESIIQSNRRALLDQL